MKGTPKRVLGVTAVAALVGMGLWTGLRQSPDRECSIWIDAARPTSLEPPMEVVEIGPKGELGLWLAAEAGHGWKGEAGGKATYQFYVAQDGLYTIWLYSLWHDACTNAVYAQIGDSRKMILGNDPVYDRWHWVKGNAVSLTAGFHQLVLSNHSANIAITKLFLTNEPLRLPPDADAAQRVLLFSDDFNGCDRGNFPLWQKLSGEWEVRRPADRKRDYDNALFGASDATAAIVYNSYVWQRIRLTVSVLCESMSQPEDAFGIRFAVDGENNYQELRICPAPNSPEAVVRHVRCTSGGIETLAEGHIPWQQAVWHVLQLDLKSERPVMVLDGGASYTGGLGGTVRGGIGFALYGKTKACFDNVAVQAVDSK